MDNSEPVSVAYPAGLGRRLGALIYDTLLVFALWMLTLFIWISAGDGEAVSGWPVQIMMFGEWVAFVLISWQRRGQTLGMASWDLKLLSESGEAPNMRQYLTRLLIAPLSILCFALGYLWVLVGRRQQTWHGILSHTIVVHLPKKKA